MAEIRLPSGATITTFPAPRAGFDPLTADEATLLLHGLPRRPVEHPDQVGGWERIVGTPTHFIEPTFRRMENRRHGPRLRGLADATETSGNWSGAVTFAGAGGSFKSVSGQWTVPNPSPALDDSTGYYSSFWIGIDGAGSNDVFQAGVECDAQNVGSSVLRTIYLWWEWYPEYEVQITNVPVSAGNLLSCFLTVLSNTTGKVLLSNLSTGAATAFQITAPTGTTLAGNCAEWIAERPEVSGSLSMLANYGEVDFTNCVANGYAPNTSNSDNINMVNGGQVISTGSIPAPGTVKCDYTGSHWSTGFSGFAAVDISGTPYVWAYRTSDGTVCIHQITPGVGNGFTQKNLYKWDTGFSSFVGFSLAGVPYVWAYRASDGTVCIHQITPGVGNGFTQKNLYKWDTGFSGFAAVDISGTPYVWAYRTSDGTVCIHQITPGVGNGFTQKNLYKWDTGFSSFVGFSFAGSPLPFVWAYRAGDGTVCIHEINAGGTGFTQIFIY
jgi:hypothetical protein